MSKNQDSSCLRNKSSYIELTTQKNGVLFTTTKMRAASQSFGETSQEYERTQSSLAKEVIGIVSTYCPVLEKLNTLVAQLDVLVRYVSVAQSQKEHSRMDLMKNIPYLWSSTRWTLLEYMCHPHGLHLTKLANSCPLQQLRTRVYPCSHAFCSTPHVGHGNWRRYFERVQTPLP